MKKSLSFLGQKFITELLNFYLGVYLNIDVEDLLNDFSAEEAKKLPKLAVCLVDAQEKVVLLHVINDQKGDHELLSNRALNSARQAVVTGIDTFSLGKEIKKKIKTEKLSKEDVLKNMELSWDLNDPVWGGFPIFEENELVGAVAVVGAEEEHRSGIRNLIEMFF